MKKENDEIAAALTALFMVFVLLTGILLFIILAGCSSKGVIGVVYNQHGQVRNVYSGSPAAKAGIQTGDKLLYHKNSKGAPGTFFDAVWIDVSDNNKLCRAKIKRIHVEQVGGNW